MNIFHTIDVHIHTLRASFSLNYSSFYSSILIIFSLNSDHFLHLFWKFVWFSLLIFHPSTENGGASIFLLIPHCAAGGSFYRKVKKWINTRSLQKNYSKNIVFSTIWHKKSVLREIFGFITWEIIKWIYYSFSYPNYWTLNLNLRSVKSFAVDVRYLSVITLPLRLPLCYSSSVREPLLLIFSLL